jgi:CheY-like chemotaxis protein
LDESLAVVQSQIEHRGRVRKSYAELPSTLGDRSAIRQVFFNLLLNAARSLPQGRAGTNEVALRTFVQGGEVGVEIRDTGQGIPPQLLPHIFDPFVPNTSIRERTDLTLPVCQRIVLDHGGRISVESSPGEGSVFRILLPAAAPLSVATPSSASEETPRRARILVIDELPVIGETIAAVLTEHDVTVVRRPSEAFARLGANDAFDVILCDLMMPELGAREILDRLKVKWPHLLPNVVFMVDGVLAPEAREFLGVSSQRRLMKPFSVGELRATVRSQLEDRARGRN